MQDVAAINRAGCDHRMVALAKSTPSSRATMSYQAKNATVMLDTNTYPKGVKVRDVEMTALNIIRHDFHGDWNYTIKPQKPQ
jgi:hypothetical protein